SRRTGLVGGLGGRLRGDEVEHEARPAEARRALTLRGPRVVELADPTLGLHLDRTARELARDIREAVLAQTPVQVPVDADPGRAAPGGLREPARIEARLARGRARYRIRQPELLVIEQVLVHEPACDPRIEVGKDEREERGEREDLRLLLARAGEIPEDSALLVPALRDERGERAAVAALVLVGTVEPDRARELRERAQAIG